MLGSGLAARVAAGARPGVLKPLGIALTGGNRYDVT